METPQALSLKLKNKANPLQRIALGVQYAGQRYVGWQRQAQGASVQESLEKALSLIADHPVVVHAAGRTDAGVHAFEQVLHFDTEQARAPSAWVLGTNTYLPPDIRVLWVKEVSEDFHARFSAVSREYRYFLQCAPVASALFPKQLAWYHGKLDLKAMQTAATYFLGEHDFSSFRAGECQAKHPVRRVYVFDVAEQSDIFIFTVRANAFLHHMVRNMVGALVAVGKGERTPDWIQAVLSAKDRTQSAATFSPDGLYLTNVEYPEIFDLPKIKNMTQFHFLIAH